MNEKPSHSAGRTALFAIIGIVIVYVVIKIIIAVLLFVVPVVLIGVAVMTIVSSRKRRNTSRKNEIIEGQIISSDE